MTRSLVQMRLYILLACFCYCHAFIIRHPFHPRKIQGTENRLTPRRQPSVYVSTVNIVNESTTYDGSCSSFTEFLLDRLQRNDKSPITVEGYVIAKRSLGKPLVFCDFQTSNTQGDLCQALLRQDYYTGDHYAGYKRCLLKGTQFRVTGIAAPTRNPGNAVLLIQSLQLLAVPRQIQHIQIILNQALEGAIPMEKVVQACHRTELKLVAPSSSTSLIQEKQHWLKGLAKEIFRSLPDDPHYPKAADQKEISRQERQGNYAMPEAPKEWQRAPPALLLENADVSTLQESLSIEQTLLQQQQQDAEGVTLISVRGWVQNRRRFRGNVTMIALVDDLVLLSEDKREVEMIDTDRLSCLVHPDLLLNNQAGLYSNLLAVGAQVWIQGQLIPDTFLGQSLVWVNDIRLVQSSSQSVTIRHLLDLLDEGNMELDEVADALLLPYQEAKQELLKLDATGRQWKANELASRLQEVSSSMRRVIDPKLLEVMEKYQHVAKSHPVISTEIIEDTVVKLSSLSSLQTKFKAMPFGMPGSKWESKKRPQLVWMGQQIRKVLESHPDYGKRKLSILDIGGGKGSLATYLGQAIDDVQIHVVDISVGAVANGQSKAERLSLPVEFQIADASSSDVVDQIEADVVVALHACGHLSDVALAHAVHRRAGFVIVPCCFNSNPHLQIPKSKTSVADWLGLPLEDWAALKLLAEVQGDIPLASEAIAMVCAVRAEAVTKHLMMRNNDEPVPTISIRSFPIQYSTRNTVLMGMCS
jgi:2-polyprenyl-3-methyl-5-hydroxy-6-metoxy-1,4-benzoquinol methylase